jgi:UDP-N-acetylmuramate: L-alanyl-gamma-D-glutamyl-meso-diaminopimelate ligase
LDGAHVSEIITHASCKVVTYSTNPKNNADWTIGDAEYAPDGTTVTCKKPSSGESITLHTTLLGEHNVQNMLGAIAALRELRAVTSEQIQESISRFSSLKRRLEQKTVNTSVYVYEDFAASRVKVMATLRALRAPHPDANIIVVFQPHTFSFRSRQALAWYPGMFIDASSVVVFSPPDLHGLASGKELRYAEIFDAIQGGNSCPVIAISDVEKIVSNLKDTLHSGDIVVLMTTGAMDGAIEAVSGMVQKTFSNS